MENVVLSWGFDIKEAMFIHMLIERKEQLQPSDVLANELIEILDKVRSARRVHISCVAHCYQYTTKSFYGYLNEFNENLINSFHMIPNKEKLVVQIEIYDRKVMRYLSKKLRNFRKLKAMGKMNDMIEECGMMSIDS